MSEFMTINDTNFTVEVAESQTPVLVEFGAEWCVPCKRMEPALVELSKVWGARVRLGKVDVDENPGLTMQFGVMSVPTMILFKGGEAVERASGLQTRERMIEKFEPYF